MDLSLPHGLSTHVAHKTKITNTHTHTYQRMRYFPPHLGYYSSHLGHSSSSFSTKKGFFIYQSIWAIYIYLCVDHIKHIFVWVCAHIMSLTFVNVCFLIHIYFHHSKFAESKHARQPKKKFFEFQIQKFSSLIHIQIFKIQSFTYL